MIYILSPGFVEFTKSPYNITLILRLNKPTGVFSGSSYIPIT